MLLASHVLVLFFCTLSNLTWTQEWSLWDTQPFYWSGKYIFTMKNVIQRERENSLLKELSLSRLLLLHTSQEAFPSQSSKDRQPLQPFEYDVLHFWPKYSSFFFVVATYSGRRQIYPKHKQDFSSTCLWGMSPRQQVRCRRWNEACRMQKKTEVSLITQESYPERKNVDEQQTIWKVSATTSIRRDVYNYISASMDGWMDGWVTQWGILTSSRQQDIQSGTENGWTNVCSRFRKTWRSEKH